MKSMTAGVVGEAAALGGHDGAAVGPGSQWAGGGGVADEFGAAFGGEDVVVDAVAFVDPGSFFEEGGSVGVAGAGAEAGGGEGDFGGAAGVAGHVGVEFDVPEVGVGPVEVGLAVVVDEDGGVDFAVFDEGVAEGVGEGAGGAGGDGDADGHAAGGAVGHGDVPVELAVAVDGLSGPGVGAGPGEAGEVEGGAVVGPVDHVGGGPDSPFLHGEVGGVVLVVAGVEVDPAVVDQWCRVSGVDRLHDRVVRPGHSGQ